MSKIKNSLIHFIAELFIHMIIELVLHFMIHHFLVMVIGPVAAKAALFIMSWVTANYIKRLINKRRYK